MFRALMRVFDYSGRSSRWEYWSFLIGFTILLVIVGAWADNYQSAHFGLQPQFSDGEAVILAFAFLGLVAAPQLALKVRRYHDFGWSGWAVLWVLVPLANIVMEFMLLFRGPAKEATTHIAPAEPQIAIYNSHGATGGSSPPNGHVDQISRLADMHAQGVLTAQEFAAAKARVLPS